MVYTVNNPCILRRLWPFNPPHPESIPNPNPDALNNRPLHFKIQYPLNVKHQYYKVRKDKCVLCLSVLSVSQLL